MTALSSVKTKRFIEAVFTHDSRHGFILLSFSINELQIFKVQRTTEYHSKFLFNFLQDIESSKLCEVGEILDAHMGDNKCISTWRLFCFNRTLFVPKYFH